MEDFFIGYVEWDIFKSHLGDIVSLFSGGDLMPPKLLSSKKWSNINFMFEHHLSGVISPQGVVESQALVWVDVESIKKKGTNVIKIEVLWFCDISIIIDQRNLLQYNFTYVWIFLQPLSQQRSVDWWVE